MPSPQERRALLAWRATGVGAILTILGLMLGSALRGWDPNTWAPFAFGASAVAMGGVLWLFANELGVVFEERMRHYGGRTGLPLNWVGVFFMVVGGAMIFQGLVQ